MTDDIPDRLACCQIVFCRNVLIYFSPEHAAAFLTRLAGQVAGGGDLPLPRIRRDHLAGDRSARGGRGEQSEIPFEYHRRRQQLPRVPTAAEPQTVLPRRPSRDSQA